MPYGRARDIGAAHKACILLAPYTLSPTVADLSQARIQRRPVLGGLLSEYERAA
jgi:hypothetical protein